MLRVALKMLMGDRVKYAGLLSGIAFTSFLVTFAASYFCGFLAPSLKSVMLPASVIRSPQAAIVSPEDQVLRRASGGQLLE